MNTIGLLGNIGSGKNTVASYFETKGCITTSFAGPLKDLCSTVFGWPREMLEGDTEHSRDFRESVDLYWSKKLGISNFTPRLAFQLIGTDVMRTHFDVNVWINSLEYRVKKLHNEHKCVVISDCRFKNEVNLVKELGGVVIQVERGERPEWFEIAEQANNGDAIAKHIMKRDFSHIHASEWDWIGCEVDHIITNDGTLKDLHKKLDKIITTIKPTPQRTSEKTLEII